MGLGWDDVVDFFKKYGFDSESMDNLSIFNATKVKGMSNSGQNIVYKFDIPDLNMSHMTTVKQILYYQNYIKVYGRGATYILKIKEMFPHQMLFLIK